MRRALGKGLSQLLGESVESSQKSAPISAIQPNHRQPRQSFDDESLEELAESIRVYGVLQPLIVRPLGEDRYELIAGERRFRAAKLAGLSEVPVLVRSADAQVSLEVALVENLQREDISPLESALAYRRLMDEFGLNQEQVAARVGKSRVAIANTVRLLRLPEEMQDAIQAGEMSEGHARALLMVESPVLQNRLFRRIVKDGLSVRESERLARPSEPKPASARTPKPAAQEDPNLRALEESLSLALGSPVRIERGGKGGRISIEFFGDEDLQRLLDLLDVSL